MLLPHNKEAYEATKDMLLEHRECCLVAATGIGKSNVATELIQEFGLNALIISPRSSIRDNWSDMPDKYGFPPTISAVTYQYFARHYKSLYGFDAYIFDEAHHTGSPIWGRIIRRFKKGLDTEFVLGLTADPNRYSDQDRSNRNVIRSVFNDHVVYGHNQKSAVNAGILPNATYVRALYDVKSLLEVYENKEMSDELEGRFQYTKENCKAIEDIIHAHIPKNAPTKGIVFVDSISNIIVGEDLVRRSFPNEIIYYIHSGLNSKANKNTIEVFKKAKSGFIIAVDMLNEGLHIEGVNTIIMLRKTSSPSIYTQQIGRSLTANGCDITIFDLVRNDMSIKKVLNRINWNSDIFSDIYGYRSSNNNNHYIQISDQTIIYDYATDILTVLEEIDEYSKTMHYRYWTSEEDQILIDNYSAMGAEVCKLLNNRTRIACAARASKLKIAGDNIRWTHDEEQILRDYYPTMGRSVSQLLPGRTEVACTLHANKLNISNKARWNMDEDQTLIDNYSDMGTNVCELLPGRTAVACLSRAYKLGLHNK